MKQELLALVEQGDFESVASFAQSRKRALGALVSLTYHSDPQVAWRAVDAMGLAADRVAEEDPEYVRNHLRRLYWLISEESGGQCWRAPEAMAEIVRRRPKQYGDYGPITVSLLDAMAEEDLDHFRPGVLWAIGRLVGISDDAIDDVMPLVVASLENPEPQVRGMAVWCLGQIGQVAPIAERGDLFSDKSAVSLYEDKILGQTTVSALVRRAVSE